jgi:hypothetical protein
MSEKLGRKDAPAEEMAVEMGDRGAGSDVI